MKRVAILISGRGSNMVALLTEMRAGTIPATPVLVLSDKPNAAGLTKARAFGVPTHVVAAEPGSEREAHDRGVAAAIDAAGAEIVCLAGYMRILSDWFVARYAGRLINVHPSLLPAFPGLHPQRQALAAGVRISGCTVHLVSSAVDAGPILAQAAVPVLPGDTEEQLAARILDQEHRIYPRALRWLCEGRIKVDGRRVTIEGEPIEAPGSLIAPR